MTQTPAGPRCPRCHRPLAAWRLNHCVYCGETFPAELKEGFAEPEGMKWVERPALPPDLSKKLEMMRVVPSGPPRKSRAVMAIAGLLAIPLIGALFYVAYSLIRQLSPGTALLILIAGVGAVAYTVSVYLKSRG